MTSCSSSRSCSSLPLPLPVLTGLGARRRGLAIPLAALTGLCFPVTWTV
ncbi:hypothetical protein KRR39_12510 [Nocardioides panacis]|uniref:Uncharacterized protein n=1 Tax=Nocardioides panacis TaxID=2849501 RepID=A0A975SV38_9ACTN|nr:hypothetical protein [Nocardioides panacis]QWZ06419.1 hypothetical protein KRR39_12510 [Nocardioides panacis]